MFMRMCAKMWLGALACGCLAAGSGSAAWSQELTAQTLIDRAEIQDLVTRYYNNFGREKAESFADFYADDAELILGARSFKGREGILTAYGIAPGQTPRPPRQSYSFIVTIGNPLIVVHGATATAQLVYTEYVIDKQGEAPRVTAQGKEYSKFVKVKGRWLYKTRQIAGGAELPDGWKD